MNEKFSECQTPFTKCWCEAVPARSNSPKCQSLIPSVSIQSDVLAFIIVSAIMAYMLFIFKLIKPFSFTFNRNNNWESKT